MAENFEIGEGQHLAGYLYKKSTNGDWQRRYFEINGYYLTYYKTQKMTKLLAALSIPQVGAIKLLGESGDQNAEIQIDLKDRQYILRADSIEDARRWVECLIDVRDSRLKPSHNPIGSRDYSQQGDDSAMLDPEPKAEVQKAARNSCFSCLKRTLNTYCFHVFAA